LLGEKSKTVIIRNADVALLHFEPILVSEEGADLRLWRMKTTDFFVIQLFMPVPLDFRSTRRSALPILSRT
jgi:hypothetical protein